MKSKEFKQLYLDSLEDKDHDITKIKNTLSILANCKQNKNYIYFEEQTPKINFHDNPQNNFNNFGQDYFRKINPQNSFRQPNCPQNNPPNRFQFNQDYFRNNINQNNQPTKEQLEQLDEVNNKRIDKLLDVLNYTITSYHIIQMQYLVLFITCYMQEKNLITDTKIPVKKSLQMLLRFKWITKDSKDFLKKFYEKSLTDNIDLSQYVIDFETFLKNASMFI